MLGARCGVQLWALTIGGYTRRHGRSSTAARAAGGDRPTCKRCTDPPERAAAEFEIDWLPATRTPSQCALQRRRHAVPSMSTARFWTRCTWRASSASVRTKSLGAGAHWWTSSSITGGTPTKHLGITRPRGVHAFAREGLGGAGSRGRAIEVGVGARWRNGAGAPGDP